MKLLLKSILFTFLISLGFSYGQVRNWEIVGRMPFRISGSEAVVVDSTIYFLGGYSDSLQNVVDWIYSYKPEQNIWSFVGHMKRKRVNFIADKLSDKIYCVGGEVNAPPRSEGALEEFDCKSFTSTIIDSNQQFNRLHSTGLIIDSTLYIIGGISYNSPDQMSPYIIEYYLPTKTIKYNFIAQFPGMRAEQMSVHIFNSIYIFGGLYNTISRDINSYGISDHQLILQNPGLMIPRADGRAIKFEDSNVVAVIGGYNEVNNALNSAELYSFKDSLNYMEHNIPQMNFKRTDFMSVNYNGFIYIFGGLNDFGMPVESIERFNNITGINETGNLAPNEYKIEQNYPNPFNASTIIRYYVPVFSRIIIKIYDVLGREVVTLADEEKLQGNYSVSFNGINLASGVYFYSINGTNKASGGNSFIETKKMILLK
ncbi:MAG: T9SS type A sorting domain-containing protein [Ignavibacteriaceae bacterium]|nr:T9SS type A sorting domain-containing protein [Ignavibacteriaceae bacterium]